VEPQRFLAQGEVSILDEKSFEITELPVKTWTSPYKESVIEVMLHGSEKIPPSIL
jgi:DNA topoisomerase-2